MSKLKFVIVIAFLLGGLPAMVSADINSDILDKVKGLMVQIEELIPKIEEIKKQARQDGSGSAKEWCHNFSTTLRRTATGGEVANLQTALGKENLIISASEKNAEVFGASTLAAVKNFQKKYAAEVLTPAGLLYPSGIVGGLTNSKLTDLFGCAEATTADSAENEPCPVYDYPVCSNGIAMPWRRNAKGCILPPVCRENSKPSIQVMYPNGGEVIDKNKDQKISWTLIDRPIDYSGYSVRIYGESYNATETLLATVPIKEITGTIVGRDLSALAVGKYKLKIVIVRDYQGTTSVINEDMSDNWFEIVAPELIPKNTFSNDYPEYKAYSATNIINPEQGTVEFLIKPQWAGTERGANRFIFTTNGKAQYDGGEFTIAKWGDRSALQIRIFQWETGGISTADWLPDTWHHVAVTWNNGIAVEYLDGIEVNQKKYTPGESTSDQFFVGTGIDGKNGARALIREFKIYNYVKAIQKPVTPTTCGDGIWNKGETLYNCRQDCTDYCIAPPDEINIASTGDYTIGTYIFPGWNEFNQSAYSWWPAVKNAKPYAVGADQPKKPLLNYYFDNNPIAVDWMLKWGLENGVSLYMYDWYWNKNGTYLQTPLENAFLKSKYLVKYPDKVKFSIMWANHVDYSFTNSINDLKNMMDYSIGHYLKLPQYQKIDGKPVFTIWDVDRLPGRKTATGPLTPEKIIDGDASTMATSSTGATTCATVNLGKFYAVDKINVRHDASDQRKYHNNKVYITSATGESAVYDSATEGEYTETPEGKTISFPSKDIKAVRNCINGNTTDTTNAWAEIEVWGTESGGNYVNLSREQELNELLQYWQDAAKKAGLPGIHLVSMYKDGSSLGIKPITGYNYIGSANMLKDAQGVSYTDYDEFINGFSRAWDKNYAISKEYLVPVSPGWDDTPWNGTKGRYVINGTPAKYETMLRNAKKFVDDNNIYPKIIINEAWDEWGEGAVLAPTERWNFGFLESIKKVFAQ